MKKLLFLAITLTGCVACKNNVNRPAPVGVASPEEWVYCEQLSDEFDGIDVDTSKWYTYNPIWLGREPSLFLKENVMLRDGALVLTGRRQDVPNAPEGYHTFSSAAVQSRDTAHYGFFEIRCKPMDSALSSAFWLYTRDEVKQEEIDIFEICGRNDTDSTYQHTLFATSHFMIMPHDIHLSDHVAHKTDYRLADRYITVGLEWNERELIWYLDGEIIRRRKNDFWQLPETINFDSEAFPTWWGLPSDSDNGGEFIIEYFRYWTRK